MTNENLPQVGKVSIGQDSADIAVVIPCDPKDFGEFIGSLLGKSQEIEKNFHGKFFIDKDNIENIFHLINQRVVQQNSASLVSFSITIFYDDDSSVRLNSLNEFSTYAEVKPRKSIGFNMSWVYLIKFAENKVPEKQDVDLSFFAEYNQRRRRKAREIEFYPVLDIANESEGCFRLRVQHTVRSWGVDIESLVTGHIGTLRQLPTQGFRGYLKNNRSLVVGILAYTYAAFIFSCLIFGMLRYSRYKIESFNNLVSNADGPDKAESMINILASYLFSGETQYITVFTIIFSILASISIPIISDGVSDAIRGSGDRSVLLLTKQARDEFDHIRSLDDKFWKNLTVTILSGVLCGVVANYVFLLIPKVSESLQ